MQKAYREYAFVISAAPPLPPVALFLVPLQSEITIVQVLQPGAQVRSLVTERRSRSDYNANGVERV